jgi:protein MAK11
LGYVKVDPEKDDQVLAVSTEDGRILFYSTRTGDLVTAPEVEGKEGKLPNAKLIAQLGGKEKGLEGRIKDFKILPLPTTTASEKSESIIVTASSDGAVRVWRISPSTDLLSTGTGTGTGIGGKTKQIGALLGSYETGNRITCLEAFVMLPRIEGAGDEDEDEDEGIDGFEGLKDEDGGGDKDEESSSDSDSD